MLYRLKIFKAIPFALSLALLFCGCTTIYNPATEQKETLLIDTPGEINMGRDMDLELQHKLKMLADPQKESRVTSIGRKVALASDRQDISYTFRIVQDKDLNAFALPGGFIYLNSGLVDAATEDELAAVLGHEIGHLAARHSVKKLQTVMGYQLLIGIALGLSNRQDIAQASDIVFNLINLGYSRKDEFLADRLGIKYTRRAGFNPYGMISFFEKLKKEALVQGPNFNLVFLSSHPPIEERIKKAENEISLNP